MIWPCSPRSRQPEKGGGREGPSHFALMLEANVGWVGSTNHKDCGCECELIRVWGDMGSMVFYWVGQYQI